MCQIFILPFLRRVKFLITLLRYRNQKFLEKSFDVSADVSKFKELYADKLQENYEIKDVRYIYTQINILRKSEAFSEVKLISYT